jgi:hypothetical protein
MALLEWLRPAAKEVKPNTFWEIVIPGLLAVLMAYRLQ